MRHVRWGILSTARIGVRRVLPALLRSQTGKAHAVASRDLARARTVATQFNIPRVHGSYEALLADAEVDAIYIPLPNSLHMEWTVRAAQAGKHVLCEKPLGLTAAQAQTMVEAASRAGSSCKRRSCTDSTHRLTKYAGASNRGPSAHRGWSGPRSRLASRAPTISV